jgi:hypothetical protein
VFIKKRNTVKTKGDDSSFSDFRDQFRGKIYNHTSDFQLQFLGYLIPKHMEMAHFQMLR